MKKAVVWGHKLHSHTSSYVHEGFYRGFQHMGYETHWLDDRDDVSGIDFSGAIFITEGQVDKRIPIRPDCKYVIHNCYSDEYRRPEIARNVLRLQVYTDDVYKVHNAEKINPWTWFKDGCLYQPWATDLLPHEIDMSWADKERERRVYYIGTIGGGQFGNVNEIGRFNRGCQEHGIAFVHRHGIDRPEHIDLVQKSYLAPACHGTWQVEKGYVACRVFKNISYGQLGLTNVVAAEPFFDGLLVVDPDAYVMFVKGHELMSDEKKYRARIREQMAIVRDKHTYINRIETILKYIP